MTGEDARAVGPSAAGLTGTSRQPRNGTSSSVKTCSTMPGGPGEPVGVGRQEEGAHAEGPAGLEPQAEPVGVPEEEPVGDLGEEPRSVSGIVGRRRAAVGDPGHRLQRHGDDLVRAHARRAGDETRAAGVVLTIGIEGGPAGRRVGARGTGTGRTDPLPGFGHGTSAGVALGRPERPVQGQQKRPARSGSGPGPLHARWRYPVAPTEQARIRLTATGTSVSRIMLKCYAAKRGPSSRVPGLRPLDA